MLYSVAPIWLERFPPAASLRRTDAAGDKNR
jgi:hypothetical protein